MIAITARAHAPAFDLTEADSNWSVLQHGVLLAPLRPVLPAEFMNTITMSAIVVTLFLAAPTGPSRASSRRRTSGCPFSGSSSRPSPSSSSTCGCGRPARLRYDSSWTSAGSGSSPSPSPGCCWWRPSCSRAGGPRHRTGRGGGGLPAHPGVRPSAGARGPGPGSAPADRFDGAATATPAHAADGGRRRPRPGSEGRADGLLRGPQVDASFFGGFQAHAPTHDATTRDSVVSDEKKPKQPASTAATS